MGGGSVKTHKVGVGERAREREREHLLKLEADERKEKDEDGEILRKHIDVINIYLQLKFCSFIKW